MTALGEPRLTWAMQEDGRTASHRDHHEVYGRLPLPGPRIIDAVEAAGLRGRGGAGFPTATKMRAVAAGPRRRGLTRPRPAVVVGNGAESEPASAKDRLLLTAVPHLVIDGLLLAADAVGADRAVLRVADRHHVLDVLDRAVAERPRAEGPPVEVVDAAPGYLSGESTATVRDLDGGRPLPRFTLRPTAEDGVGRAPTLVLNVETLAGLALLARYGPDWYRAAGTADEPGTVLLTVHPVDAEPMVVEAPLGVPLDAVLTAAGGPPRGISHLLTGGYGGTWVRWPAVARLPLTRADLRAAGGTLGAGVLVALPGSACGLVETAPVVSYLADASANQCGPCLNGLPAIADALHELAAGKADAGVVSRLRHWCGLVDGRGACHHPDGVAALVRSTLERFADEVQEHVVHGWCGRRYAGILPLPGGRSR